MYQSDPPLPPKETLPTMYDLPSEEVGDRGVPDEFHLLQPELLRLTFRPPNYSEDEVFVAADLNLYYDVRHPRWYKRPDWFAVLGVSRLYEERDLRLSYVTWQESRNPLVVVELTSPGTEAEDLGRTLREANQPPTKWTVYEQILRIPYYFLFNRYTDEFQGFGLMMGRYQPLSIEGRGIWLEEAELGLGLWQGEYQGIPRLWLRWFDRDGNWILTPAEREKQRAEAEKQRADSEKQRADSVEAENQRLRQFLEENGLSLPNDHSS